MIRKNEDWTLEIMNHFENVSGVTSHVFNSCTYKPHAESHKDLWFCLGNITTADVINFDIIKGKRYLAVVYGFDQIWPKLVGCSVFDDNV